MGSEESQEAIEIGAPLESRIHWIHGAIAGFVAALAMGVVMSLVNQAVLQNLIAGLYGLRGSLVAGWIVHLIHGTLFGVLFAIVLSDPTLYRVSEWSWKTILAGIVYGLVLALAAAGLIMPIWLSAVGLESPPQVPNVTVPIVAYHLVYGAVLGGVYWAFDKDSAR